MSPRPATLVLLGVWVAGAVPTSAAAQTQAQRTLIEAFRDSLEMAADSNGLSRLEAGVVRMVRARPGDPVIHLRLGFLALRLGELGRPRGYEDAAAEFQAVTRFAPAWPYGWYGLGLAEYSLARSGMGGQGGDAANPAGGYNRAVAAFARSAGSDHSFAETLVEQAFNGRLQRQPSRSTVALEALRTAASAARSPSLLHGLGTVEREFGDPEEALKAFDTLLSLAGRSRGVPLLEVARTRFLLGRADGAAAYYAGAAFDDSATVGGYRVDLAAIASPKELTAFDGTRGSQRVEFLRRFWGSRDDAEFRQAGDRVKEHYRRLYVARRTFPGFVPTRWRDLGRRIAIADMVDHRGVIYLRHGDPDDRVSMATLGFEPNESWRYARAEGDMVVHFVARRAADDFSLVESLFDVVDPRASASTAVDPSSRTGDEQLLRSREPLSPFYRAGRGAPDRELAFRVAERAMSRTSALRATSTDSHRRRYPVPLDASADLVLLGAATGGGVARIALAVPFAATGTAWLGEGLTFPLRVRVVAIDTSDQTRVSVDSTIRARAVMYRGERWLAGDLSLPLPAGVLRVRLAVEEEDQEGTVLPFRTLEVPSTPDSLSLSELAVGVAESPWRVETEFGPVALNPLELIGRERQGEIAFEARGRAGTILTCQVTVIRTDEPGVAYNDTWREAMSNGKRLIRRRLETQRLQPGTYRVEITVADGQGSLSRRWQEFRIGP